MLSPKRKTFNDYVLHGVYQGPRIWPGNLYLHYSPRTIPLSSLGGLQLVEGNLAIEDSATASSFDLGKLETVTGFVLFTGLKSLLSLGNLKKIGSYLDISHSGILSLGKLLVIGYSQNGELMAPDNSLRDYGELVRVRGLIIIQENSALPSPSAVTFRALDVRGVGGVRRVRFIPYKEYNKEYLRIKSAPLVKLPLMRLTAPRLYQSLIDTRLRGAYGNL